jgi:hypothetical protein
MLNKSDPLIWVQNHAIEIRWETDIAGICTIVQIASANKTPICLVLQVSVSNVVGFVKPYSVWFPLLELNWETTYLSCAVRFLLDCSLRVVCTVNWPIAERM